MVTCGAIVLSNHPQWFSSAFLLLFSSQLVVGLFRERIAKAYLLLPCHHLALLIWFGVCIPSESSSVNELSALPLTWRAYGKGFWRSVFLQTHSRMHPTIHQGIGYLIHSDGLISLSLTLGILMSFCLVHYSSQMILH